MFFWPKRDVLINNRSEGYRNKFPKYIKLKKTNFCIKVFLTIVFEIKFLICISSHFDRHVICNDLYN